MVRIFECQECGTRNPATKIRGYTGVGHRKDFYCVHCKKITEQKQVDTK